MPKITKDKRTLIILLSIFIFAIIVRFINFGESLYFGYDEARDAFDSQNIYLLGDIKLSGPPASAFKGINHGPIYLYFIGPLFLLGGGNPYFVSAIFRIINALGIIPVYFVTNLYFGRIAGIISAFLFAVSFEQHQYAIFTGNPSLSNLFWIILFLGAGIVYKYKEKRKLGLFLMFFGATAIFQFDLILAYSLIALVLLLLLLRNNLKGIAKKDWLKITFLGFLPAYSYLLAEIRNNFLGVKTLGKVVFSGVSSLTAGENPYLIFFNNFVGLFEDNVFSLFQNTSVHFIFFLVLIGFLLIKAKNKFSTYFVLVWILIIFSLLITRGFMPYYSYAGVGIGVIVGVSFLLNEVYKKTKILALIILMLILFSNLTRIIDQSQKALVVDIKAQPGMKLSDEIDIVNKTYEYAGREGFTIRTTSMPYKIQTVWAYLYQQYGFTKYGYLPYFETGNIEGFPGKLPTPKKGTTCTRFLIREPVRGIPVGLINSDVKEENLFSKVVKEEKIGDFLLQTRKAKDEICHTEKGSF